MTPPKRILLVEDDPDIRRVTAATLKGAGYEVDETENGRAGIERVADRAPDLVVLDVMMPEMNGAEFCRALVEDLKLPSLPVLILSSVNEKSGLMRSLESVDLRRREFLKKPVGPVELKLRIAQMLGLDNPPPPAPSAPASAPPRATLKPTPPKSSAEAPPATLVPRSDSGKEEPSPELRYRILLVDDDRDLLSVHRFALEQTYDVATAQNGLDGLEMMDLFEPDFVVVDYNMPVMDGLEMVELMRRHPHFHRTPALFLTANQERDLPRQAHEAGGNLFLRKPIEPERLRRAIAHIIQESGIKPGSGTMTPEPAPPPADAPAPPVSRAGPARMAPARPRPPADDGGGKAKLRPRASKAPQSQKAAPAPGREPTGAQLVRLLIVDHDPSTADRLLQLVEKGFRGRIHFHHSDDHRDALANMARWEPDLILYNPRNPGLDGIAFFQLFKIKRLDIDVEFAFVGTEFMNAEIKYSRQSFGRDVLDLNQGDSRVLYEIQSMIEKAEGKPRPKRHTIEEIRKEDEEEARQKAKVADRTQRQRAFDRQRYSQIQNMLDNQV